jgi:hypothetical protein
MKTALFAMFVLLASSSLAQPSVPDISFDSVPDFLKLPSGTNFGEVAGVAVNSKGHGFVFTRSNSASGPAYAPAAAQLLEVRNLLQELEQLALDREHLADVFDGQAVVRHASSSGDRDGLPAAHCRAARA